MNLEDFSTQTNALEENCKPQLFDFTDYADFLNAYVGAYGKYSHGPYN